MRKPNKSIQTIIKTLLMHLPHAPSKLSENDKRVIRFIRAYIQAIDWELDTYAASATLTLLSDDVSTNWKLKTVDKGKCTIELAVLAVHRPSGRSQFRLVRRWIRRLVCTANASVRRVGPNGNGVAVASMCATHTPCWAGRSGHHAHVLWLVYQN